MKLDASYCVARSASLLVCHLLIGLIQELSEVSEELERIDASVACALCRMLACRPPIIRMDPSFKRWALN